MQGWIQAGIGVVVSVVLFLVGYRQTVGASQERAQAATDELVTALTRLLVGERHVPSTQELRSMLEAQSRVHRVHTRFLPSPQQLLDSVLNRVVQLEFVSDVRRSELMDVLRMAGGEDVDESATKEPVASALRADSVFIVLVAASSVLGVVASWLITQQVFQPSGSWTAGFSVRFMSALAAVSIALLIVRLRTGPTPAPSLPRYRRLADHALRDLLDAYGIRNTVAMPDAPFDYALWLPAGKTLLDSTGRASSSRKAQQLARAVHDEDAVGAIVVLSHSLIGKIDPAITVVTHTKLLSMLAAAKATPQP